MTLKIRRAKVRDNRKGLEVRNGGLATEKEPFVF